MQLVIINFVVFFETIIVNQTKYYKCVQQYCVCVQDAIDYVLLFKYFTLSWIYTNKKRIKIHSVVLTCLAVLGTCTSTLSTNSRHLLITGVVLAPSSFEKKARIYPSSRSLAPPAPPAPSPGAGAASLCLGADALVLGSIVLNDKEKCYHNLESTLHLEQYDESSWKRELHSKYPGKDDSTCKLNERSMKSQY